MSDASPPVPIAWSIAGTDCGGGAGLAADLRAADALGVHLCPVVAAVTAQNSIAVTQVAPLDPALLQAQLQALAGDMPPRAVKTGLLGGPAQVQAVARWIDRLRDAAPVALVVDPVLKATTGAAFADDATVAAYRDWLLPRATVLTPNVAEAARLLGHAVPPEREAVPAMARALRAQGAQAVVVTGGDQRDGLPQALDWLDAPQARGWMALPRIATPHGHGTGCTYASALAAALALGHAEADAALLAKMATTQALRHARAAGAGAGPVRATPGFGSDPALMPQLSWDEAPQFADGPAASASRPLGLYAITGDVDHLQALLAAGVRTLQLRIKLPPSPSDADAQALRDALKRAVTACRTARAELYVNDHWALAHELGAPGVHLGQEDLQALGADGRRRLLASGLQLGVSSHSLWELARARTLAPRYIACGPVWPTQTKAMPWQPQGLDNLAWWVRMAGRPVVAIGGVLAPEQARDAARCGVDGVCLLRALQGAGMAALPAFQAALVRGAAIGRQPVPPLPHPSLAAGTHGAG